MNADKRDDERGGTMASLEVSAREQGESMEVGVSLRAEKSFYMRSQRQQRARKHVPVHHAAPHALPAASAEALFSLLAQCTDSIKKQR